MLEPTLPEEMRDLFCHIAPVHDERVRGRKYDEVRCPLDPCPVNADLAIVWPWYEP